MAAEQASEDSLECNEEPGALGACGDNDDAVRGARQSNEIAGGVHAADQEAGTRTEAQDSAAGLEEVTACSTTSEGSSETGEKDEGDHQPRQRHASDVLDSEISEEASIVPGTCSVGHISGASALNVVAGERSDGEDTASGNAVSGSDGSPRNSASNDDLGIAPQTKISSPESGSRDGHLAQLRMSADGNEDSLEAGPTATSDADSSVPLPFEEPFSRESFASDSVETESLTAGIERWDHPAREGAAGGKPRDKVEGAEEGNDATALQDSVDDSTRVPAGHTRSTDDGINNSFAPDSDRGQVSRIGADARKLVDEVISSSLVAIPASVAAMSQEDSSKLKLDEKTHDGQDLTTSFEEDSQSLGEVGCREAVKRRSSRLQAQEEAPASPMHSPRYASLPMDFAEDFLSHVYEVVSAMGAAAAATVAPKAATAVIAESSPSVVTETLPEKLVRADQEPVAPPVRLGSTEDIVVPEPGAVSLVNETLASVATETVALSTAGAAETDRGPVENVIPGEGHGTTEASDTMASPSNTLSRPLSASIRSAVVADYLSEVIPVLALAGESIPLTRGAHLEAAPSVEGVTNVSQGLHFGQEKRMSSSALTGEGLPEQRSQPTETLSLGNEPAREEEKEKGGAESATHDTASDTTPTSVSITLRRAVVEEYMSDTLPRVVAAISVPTAPRAGEPVDAEAGVQGNQGLEQHRGVLSTDRDDSGSPEHNTYFAPTPPGTPDNQNLSNTGSDTGLEVPTTPVADCKSRASWSVEATTYLIEVGNRAKRMQESSDESRTDASSWLRDTGSRALSSQGGEQVARKASVVVEECPLGTLREVVASEAVVTSGAAETASCSPTTSTPADATTGVPGNGPTHGLSSLRDPRATVDGHKPTVDAGDVGPGSENSVPMPASRSSHAEGAMMVGQGSEDQGETPSEESTDDQDGGAPNVLAAPSISGSPSEAKLTNICPELEPGLPFKPDPAAVDGSPAPQSMDALAFLTEIGSRAKCLQENSEKSRTDASSWLREVGSKAISSQGGEQAARKASAVVEDYLMETLRGVVQSETAAGATATAPSSSPRTCVDADFAKIVDSDRAAPGVSLPRDQVPTATTEAAAEPESLTTSELSVPMRASQSSNFEAKEAIGQGPTKKDGEAPKESGDNRGGGGEQTLDDPGSTTPPGTPNGERHGRGASRKIDPEESSHSDPVCCDSPSPAPRSIEALSYLAGVGLRAKSLQEAADWLCLAGGRAKSAEERASGARDDAALWLRDAGVKALSSPARPPQDQVQAAECLLLAEEGAKCATDRADRARIDASSWLREKGSRALSLSGREQARRLECVAWLRLTGEGAKSAQGRADKAHEDASLWLRSTGVRAVSLQDRAEGARSDAAAWLKSKAILELERTGSAEGFADAVAVAAVTSLQGQPEAKNTGPRPQGGNLNQSVITVSDSPRAGYHPNTPTTEVVGSGFVGERAHGDTPSGGHGVVPTDVILDSSNAYPAVADNTSTPSLPRQTLLPVKAEAGTTSATPTAADAASADLEQPPGCTASTDRTAPAPWLEPATTPLASTAAGTEDFGRMLGAGEKEWARVSLSRTPPFDALNSPSLPVRYAPVRGRPRPLPPDAEIAEVEVPTGETVHRRATGARKGVAPSAEGPGWMEFFAPPDQMAPRGDAYGGSDGCGSAEASASTTVRADSSAGSFTSGLAGPSQRERDGTDDLRRPRQRGDEDRDDRDNDQGWRCSGGGGGVGGSCEGWGEGLGEVLHPAGEAHERMVNRIAVAGGGPWEETGSFSSASRDVREKGSGGHRGGGGKRWHKKAEQSRQYMRRWQAFLGRAHRHFDGEADVRKRMSLVRRAHPDVTNEVAYVALAQSRGRSSEAAAVLHLPRAKDEAAMVAMMLDVTTFIYLARQAAERRRRSRQLERQRRVIAAAGRGAGRGPFRRNVGADGDMRQSSTSAWQQIEEERWNGGGWEGDVTDQDGCVGDRATGRSSSCRQRLRSEQQQQDVSSDMPPAQARNRTAKCSGSGSSPGKPQGRRSDSAPSPLPPIEGPLTEGTPPSPGSLKAVLSTSKSVAVEVPMGLGFSKEAGGSKKDEGFERDDRGSKRTRRDLKAMLWARAHWQRQRMAEMAAPGKQHQQQKKEGGVENLDALMERFLCESRTLDRDSEYLNARLRGRQEKLGFRGGRGLHRNGAGGTGCRAEVGTTFGSNPGHSCAGLGHAWRNGRGLDGCKQSSSQTPSPVFMASVNSNETAPFMFLSEKGEGVDDACSTSSPMAAASARCVVDVGGCSRDRGSCRVQSYFTQALGDESLCGSKNRHRA